MVARGRAGEKHLWPGTRMGRRCAGLSKREIHADGKVPAGICPVSIQTFPFYGQFAEASSPQTTAETQPQPAVLRSRAEKGG